MAASAGQSVYRPTYPSTLYMSGANIPPVIVLTLYCVCYNVDPVLPRLLRVRPQPAVLLLGAAAALAPLLPPVQPRPRLHRRHHEHHRRSAAEHYKHCFLCILFTIYCVKSRWSLCHFTGHLKTFHTCLVYQCISNSRDILLISIPQSQNKTL